MPEAVIKIENLSKIYKLYDNPVDRLKESLNPFHKKYHRDFYALRDVYFEIERGESVGIIGKNGSGKSTLLKILTGVLTPSAGSVTVNGKSSALLELGTGFNAELTGLENLYFSGTIMGYSKKEMDKKVDQILAFADIGEFINQPVKIYSSGMYVRLAFSVAINVNPDILIIDEALAVGDMRFQQKCYRKIQDFRDRGKTILFCSHDTGAIITFCSKVIWLSEGQIKKAGAPEEVVKEYIAYMTYDAEVQVQKDMAVPETKETGPVERSIKWEDVSACASFGEGKAKIECVSFYFAESNEKVTVLKGGEKVCLSVKAQSFDNISNSIIGFNLKNSLGINIFGTNTIAEEYSLPELKSGGHIEVSFYFIFPDLADGRYSIDVAIAEGTQITHIQHHWVYDALFIEVINKESKNNFGIICINDVSVDCKFR